MRDHRLNDRLGVAQRGGLLEARLRMELAHLVDLLRQVELEMPAFYPHGLNNVGWLN